MLVVGYEQKKAVVKDGPIPADGNIRTKEHEKTEEHQRSEVQSGNKFSMGCDS